MKIKALKIALMACLMTAITSGCARNIQRYGSVIGIDKENIAEYKRLHGNAWPGVLKQIDKSNIENYSIYLGETSPGQYYLFSYFEYTGGNFESDMARMAKDETTQKWWAETDPLQTPLPTRQKGQHWANWEEVFHHGGPDFAAEDVKSRHGWIIGVAKENILAYTQLHQAVWPDVLARLDLSNVRNYSIYLGQLTPGEYVLFSYLEYVGDDFDADMANMSDEVTKVWWIYTDPLQKPLPTRKEGEHWLTMEEVFHN